GSLIAALDALNGGGRRLETLLIDQPPLPPELEAGVALTDVDEPITAASLETSLAPAPRRRRLRKLALDGAITLLLLLGLALAVREGAIGGGRLAEEHALSWVGISAVMLIYTLASFVFVPINLLIAATAAAFGPLLGFAYALAGALLVATLMFGIGRAIGRDPVRRFAGRRVNTVSRRLSQHGLWAMTLLRLLPIAPFTVVNLAAGASELRLRDFVLGSTLGMLPGILLLTAFGDRLGAWLRRPDTANLAILLSLTFAVVLLALLLGWWARRRRPR
ncbi:MAG: phospholipase, partial [Geminicoccaceae bacterium]|nr:phospholipase [Geminicoccaceae bacterium]